MSKKHSVASVPDLAGGTLLNTGSMPAVVGVKPAGTQVLIELLSQQEVYNTQLTLQNKLPQKEFQGYVRAVGPNVKEADWGFKVGDRVLISGSGVPAPKYGGCERERVLMEPHSVKGVLLEE